MGGTGARGNEVKKNLQLLNRMCWMDAMLTQRDGRDGGR